MLVNDKSTWRKVTHPTEADVWFRLRPLTDDEYQLALDAKFDQVIDKAKNLGPELTKSLQSAPSAQTPSNPMQSLHAMTAIIFAVQEWSYTQECSEENKRFLDKNTQDWLKEVIVEMNGPLPTTKSPLGNGESNKDSSPTSSLELIDSGEPASVST